MKSLLHASSAARMTVASAVAVLLSASSASAAPEKGSSSSKGDLGNKGGSVSGGTTGGASAGSSSSSGSAEAAGDRGATNGGVFSATGAKKWSVEGIFETHHLIRQNDLGGAAPNRHANFVYALARYDFTPEDRVGTRLGASQRFIADEGETGFRFDDILLYYRRKFHLPQRIDLNVIPGVTLPTSFGAKKAGMILGTRLGLAVERTFGDFDVVAQMLGIRYFMRYDTAEGGAPNPKWAYAMTLSGEYHMPFHRQLSVGALLSDEYAWYYRVGHASPPAYGAVNDPQFGGDQPAQQAYGGQIFVRYLLPQWQGLRSDVLLAFANGDATLGYTSVLHDGVSHEYVAYRRNAEIYLALSAAY